MNYLYQFDEAALQLVLRGLMKLPLEEALPLYEQIKNGAEEQRRAQPQQEASCPTP